MHDMIKSSLVALWHDHWLSFGKITFIVGDLYRAGLAPPRIQFRINTYICHKNRRAPLYRGYHMSVPYLPTLYTGGYNSISFSATVAVVPVSKRLFSKLCENVRITYESIYCSLTGKRGFLIVDECK